MVVLVMIAIDILIKIVVDTFFMNQKLLLCENFGFNPFLNRTQLSVLNNEFDMKVDLIYLMGLNILAIILLLIVKHKLKKDNGWTKTSDIAINIVLAGAVCSLIDKVFWGGSLDYILLGTQIVDLKDIYLFAGCVIYLLEAAKQIKNSIKNKI